MIKFIKYPQKLFIKTRQQFFQLMVNNYYKSQGSDWLNNPSILCASPLSSSHLKNCHVVESREKMLEHLPKGATVAEVGTQYGHFAEKIVSVTKPQKFHIIDIDLSLLKRELNQGNKKLLQEKISDNKIEIHEGDSSSILKNFPDSYFDWIYIDGDHSYEGVKKDINEGFNKVKEDGLLIFNDYTIWSVAEMIPYGIPRAVNEFCIANDWEIIFFALDSWGGYHDVAIKRMNVEKLG
ncbi:MULTISPECIES: class I SAM-dependent methyltransferase [unclassified Coleofasciculus]|uniref:class I SAM-dependent methyltransferase n=1 Tax=unclassified Coleofasciculus TaxID=2692782 RepID=UPI00187EE895|nr:MULTISPECIES: class I SAM-dependent methyltransferase [unclassified Coleofasciculus]MBE9127587.1 class I SAM-dependent methyltransferase [Coleofasciculus sp. LEGE 07081]MBE9149782.1 class I SAM-dependent methyltransferase [Coleofasciculus sp. LEGE 07092]